MTAKQQFLWRSTLKQPNQILPHLIVFQSNNFCRAITELTVLSIGLEKLRDGNDLISFNKTNTRFEFIRPSNGYVWTALTFK